MQLLGQNQTASGKFQGYSAADQNFAAITPTDTIFSTALILDCLNNVVGSFAIRRKAADYLVSHKSKQWTWNYWERSSSARAYPDDLDDTVCAVASLLGHDPTLVDAVAQAHLAQSLIACEMEAGGPYATWLMPASDIQWRDVDVVVNANIGHMLSKLGVNSQALEEYISQCIANKQLTSPYYVGVVPVYYCIARWYKGPQLQQLGDLISNQLRQTQLTILERAMLITAACRVGRGSEVDNACISPLLSEAYMAAPLYYEPPVDGRWQYAGSVELTTAFAIEALSVWRDSRASDPVITRQPTTLQELYQQQIQHQQRAEIIDIAGIIARAGGWKLKDSILRHLNRGSRNGWLAYSIYDDFLDGEGLLNQLGVANMAMRNSIKHFKQAIPDQDFCQFVDTVFTTIDTANYWEILHARDLNRLPKYGFYAKLMQRSWGHVLAPTGVLLAAGYQLQSPEVTQLHTFFRHYLIARQLCDDAHDWLDDLRRGHTTAVVTLLLRDCSGESDTDRQLHFWNTTIDQVNQLVRHHIAKAQAVLDGMKYLVKTSELQQWLDNLEAVCAQAEEGRRAALQFIDTFSSSNLVH